MTNNCTKMSQEIVAGHNFENTIYNLILQTNENMKPQTAFLNITTFMNYELVINY